MFERRQGIQTRVTVDGLHDVPRFRHQSMEKVARLRPPTAGPATLHTHAEDLGADLTVLVIVLLALVGALFAHLDTLLDHVTAELGAVRHEPDV